MVHSYFQSASEGDSRVYNTHLILDNHGNVAGKYNKLHLFDIDIKGGVTLKESDSFIPGKEMPPVVKTPVGNVGLSIVSLNNKVFLPGNHTATRMCSIRSPS